MRWLMTAPRPARGYWSIELAGFERSEQEYVANTAVLVTRLFSSNGSAVEVTDFCPRFERDGRMFRPQMLVRRVRPLAGTPRICVKLQAVVRIRRAPARRSRTAATTSAT